MGRGQYDRERFKRPATEGNGPRAAGAGSVGASADDGSVLDDPRELPGAVEEQSGARCGRSGEDLELSEATGPDRGASDDDAGDGQDGAASDRLDGAHETWSAFSGRLTAIEHEHRKHRRIVRVWHPQPSGDLWHGAYANAPVEAGEMAVRWNDGEVVTL